MSARFKTSSAVSRAVVTVACGVCDKTETMATATGQHGHHMPPEGIARAFRRKGWIIGGSPRKDRCPDHAKPERKHQPEELPQMAADPKHDDIRLPPQIAGSSERPPRAMTKIDRRLVIQKLEEVYLDETTGYSTGWHDQRVADDMRVPRAWVEALREENFGPIKADQSAEIIALTASMARLEVEVGDLGKEALRVRRAAATIIAEANKSVDDALAIEKRSSELAARLTSLRDEVRKLTGRS